MPENYVNYRHFLNKKTLIDVVNVINYLIINKYKTNSSKCIQKK